MKDKVYVGALISEEHLKHHGILGMHWGVRRYQNEDGTLTAAGKKRYEKQVKKELRKKQLAANIHNKAQEYDRNKNWHEAYNKATDEFNTRINGINAKYSGKDLGKNFETKAGQKYVTEVGKMWKDVYTRAATDRFGATLSVESDGTVRQGYEYIASMPFMNQYDKLIRS